MIGSLENLNSNSFINFLSEIRFFLMHILFFHLFKLAPHGKLHTEDNKSIEPLGCRLGNQFHLVGSVWYPYLLPNGFDKCNICMCNSLLKVSCTRREKCSEVRKYSLNWQHINAPLES